MTLKIVVGNFIVTYVQIMIVGMGVGRMGCGLVATAVATAVYVISLSSEISLYICSLVRDLLSAAATLFTKRVWCAESFSSIQTVCLRLKDEPYSQHYQGCKAKLINQFQSKDKIYNPYPQTNTGF